MRERGLDGSRDQVAGFVHELLGITSRNRKLHSIVLYRLLGKPVRAGHTIPHMGVVSPAGHGSEGNVVPCEGRQGSGAYVECKWQMEKRRPKQPRLRRRIR
ncbi:MAG: hypothetical protein NVS4B8_01570 [Herpetosiphon sp.]